MFKLLKHSLAYLLTLCLFAFPVFASQSTPAYKLHYKIEGRCHLPKVGPTVFVSLKAENFPETQPALLVAIKMDNEPQVLFDDVFVDEEGDVYSCSDDSKPLKVGLNLFALGEPTKIVLIDNKTLYQEKMECAVCSIVPFPLTVKDENGHSMSITLASPDGKMFLVDATGFEPGEVVKVYSQSGKELLKYEYEISEDGTYTGIIQPAVKGQKNGTATYEIIGKTTKGLKISYKWGNSALQRVKNYAL